MSWTDERIAQLKKMWKEGKSAAEIAKVLGKGVTRNAVIGKAHRMDLSGRPSPIKKPPSSAAKTAAKKEPAKKPALVKTAAAPVKKGVPVKLAASTAAKPVLKSVAPVKNGTKPVLKKPSVTLVSSPAVKKGFPSKEIAEPRKMEKEEIPADGGVALIDLTERMCKWPIGDPRDADFTFCGHAGKAGTPYCPHHASIAYQTSGRNRAVVAAVAEEKEVEDVGVEDDEAINV